MNISSFKVSIVIPIYNEEGNILVLSQKLIEVLYTYDYEIIFIDDGSKDNTLCVLKELHARNQKVHYLSFSRNFGHQNALRAGLNYASGDCVISMDGDLQHPPELIPIMIEKWKEGYEIVYTKRKDDPKTSIIKRLTSRCFYCFMNIISDLDIEQGTADFRLLDKSIVEVFHKIHENALFIRAMVRWLGFKQYGLEYMPNERFWGKTKYSPSKMLNFAIEGITSFSVKPLRISTFLGGWMALFSFFYGIYALWIKFFTNNSVQGWTSILIVVTFIGGIQLIMIGILGEYLGRLFIEAKNRPNYIVREKSFD